MIQIHLNPARVEGVLFVAASELEEDFDLAAWQVIRALVDRMDSRLRKAARRICEDGPVHRNGRQRRGVL